MPNHPSIPHEPSANLNPTVALAYFVAPAFTNIQWKTCTSSPNPLIPRNPNPTNETNVPADIIFGVLCTAMTAHIFFTYPETVGRTLEEIDYVFECDLPVWRTGEAKSQFAEDVEAVQRGKSVGEERVVKGDEEKVERVERA